MFQCVKTIFVHAGKHRASRVRHKAGAAVQHGRQPGGQCALHGGADIFSAGSHLAITAKTARNRSVVGIFKAGSHLKIKLLPLARADDAPGCIIVDDGEHRQLVAARGVQLVVSGLASAPGLAE